MTDQSIMHSGLVESVEGNVAHVRIERLSACAACHAKGLCSIDKKKQIVDVLVDGPISVGQQVNIVGKTSLGMQAVLIAFIIPFVVMVSLLTIFFSLNFSDTTSASIALGGVLVYYIILIPFRKKIDKKFIFTLQK